MRWGVLWTFLPDEALPLLIVGVGLALMLGLISGRAALGLLGLLLLSPLLAPLIEELLGELPPWISLIILAFLALALFRGLAALILGQRAADAMAGNLAADLVRLMVRLLFLPLRIGWWVVRILVNDGRG
jgi:hypothetical protein